MSDTGLNTVASGRSAAETVISVQSAVRNAGMTVFAIFDHAVAASGAGLALRPTTVIAFGNPAAGTRLMQASQIAGLDLPLKILVWETESGEVKLTYTDPHALVARYGLGPETEVVIAAMARVLDSIVHEAGAATARAS